MVPGLFVFSFFPFPFKHFADSLPPLSLSPPALTSKESTEFDLRDQSGGPCIANK